MRLEFLFLGKTRESYLARGIEDFQKRLKPFVRTNVRIIKEKKWRIMEPAARMREEGKMLLAALSSPSLLVVLDRSGHNPDSEELARLLSRWEQKGYKCVSFLLGGPLGMAPDLIGKADMVFSLSNMTFTHEMSRLILLEQIYRAYTIKAGTGYHK